MSHREQDTDLLRKTLEEDEKLTDWERAAFSDMLAYLMDHNELTDKQRAKLREVAERVGIYFNYQNLVSEGMVPRGREVELLVKDKPLRPPGRRSE